MNKYEIIKRLKNIARHAVHTFGEESFVMSLDDGIAVHEAIELLEKSETNSSDTISRQAAIGAFEDTTFTKNEILRRLLELPSVQPEQSVAEWQKDFREYINALNIPRDDYRGIMEYINEVPSAETEPVKHGKWKVETDCEGKTRRCICNLCGYKTDWYTWKNPEYCGGCGAIMDDGEE